MAPEQARGQTIDQRTDIWAFGWVLYEMLTGRAPFEGENLAGILASVLEREPNWTRLPANVPARVRDLLHRGYILLGVQDFTMSSFTTCVMLPPVFRPIQVRLPLVLSLIATSSWLPIEVRAIWLIIASMSSWNWLSLPPIRMF
jgi:serine/threonine protein kinase